ncbi:unnamed protein product [Cochlearia groenlandica]
MVRFFDVLAFVLALSVKAAYGGEDETFLQRVVNHSCSSNGTIRSWDTRSFHQVLCIDAENDQHVSSFSCGGAEDNLLADSCPHYYAAQYKEDLEVADITKEDTYYSNTKMKDDSPSEEESSDDQTYGALPSMKLKIDNIDWFMEELFMVCDIIHSFYSLSSFLFVLCSLVFLSFVHKLGLYQVVDIIIDDIHFNNDVDEKGSEVDDEEEELHLWASYRGQNLVDEALGHIQFLDG